MSFKETVKLPGGKKEMPLFGLGVWNSKPGEVKQAVITAVKEGYTHLDLAKIYQNNNEVGEALKELFDSGVKRESLWITSKLWNSAHRPDLVESAIDDTLQELGLDYLDLYLIHWPVAFDSKDPNKELIPKGSDGNAKLDLKTTLVDTWGAMIEVQKKGKTACIGVSNFTASHIEGIIKGTGVVPAVNQIELHPLLPQADLLRYCQIKGIHVTAYSPLVNPATYSQSDDLSPMKNKHVLEVAKEVNADAGQVLLAWGYQRGYSVIPKSVTPSRIKSNFQQIRLSKEQIKKVDQFTHEIGSYKRMNVPINYNPVWQQNVFFESVEIQAEHTVNIGV